MLKQIQMDDGLLQRSLSLRLYLSRGVAHRVFLSADAGRLIVDLKTTDAGPAQKPGVPTDTAEVPEVLSHDPEWLRVSVALKRRFAVSGVELSDVEDGAVLGIRLIVAGQDATSADHGAPPGVFPAEPNGSPVRGLRVVIDAGHGGVDPGAARSGVQEKDVVLYFANVLKRVLSGMPGFEVVMTRSGDEFVSLSERVRIAESSGADVFLSIHANAVEDPGISGAIVFTRSETASNSAANARARSENQSGGAPEIRSVNGPRVDTILDALAERRAKSRSKSLARRIVPAFRVDGTNSTQAPIQAANFQVLSARNIASVLLELGFLSNADDFARLNSAGWHEKLAVSLAEELLDWSSQHAGGGR